MASGDGTALNVTQEGNRRVFVGLGWDPNEKPRLGDTLGALIGARKKHHDLDLSCFYFGNDGAYLGVVSAQPEAHTGAAGRIYHSGDNVEGIGEGDDEQVSVELKDLPNDIHHLVFKAAIKSGHSFSDVAGASIRLCDGYTGRCFVEHELSGEHSSENNAYVFVHLYRQDDGWMIHTIAEFQKNTLLEDWGEQLKRYL